MGKISLRRYDLSLIDDFNLRTVNMLDAITNCKNSNSAYIGAKFSTKIYEALGVSVDYLTNKVIEIPIVSELTDTYIPLSVNNNKAFAGSKGYYKVNPLTGWADLESRLDVEQCMSYLGINAKHYFYVQVMELTCQYSIKYKVFNTSGYYRNRVNEIKCIK